MKRFIFSMLAMAAIAFVGCDKEEENTTTGTLIGTWEMTKSWSQTDGWDTQFGAQWGYVLTVRFYENGSVVVTQIDSNGTETQRNTYQIVAGTLRITLPNGQTNVAVIESLTSTELILAYGDTKEYYKRIG
ncbi:MAG: lipocalin family protein [Alistipes sp.]|nr:lipocalin family protein [Alistipes sp.]